MPDDVSVAIVDDERDIVGTYEKLFKWRGIPVAFVAFDGHEAVEKFKSSNPRPRVMIIDYRLPGMNGLDVMRDVLKVKPDTKIIILSADDSVRTEAIRAGANIFLLKPVRNSVMVETIKSL